MLLSPQVEQRQSLPPEIQLEHPNPTAKLQDQLVELDAAEYAAGLISRRFQLSVQHARRVVELAALGGRAAP